MNRKINFHITDVWYQKATARAQSLGLNLSEYVRGVVSKDFSMEEKKMEETKEVWVLTNPDHEHYNEEYANLEITRLAEKWGVEVEATTKTHDGGHGVEKMYVVFGSPEDIKEFEAELEEALY